MSSSLSLEACFLARRKGTFLEKRSVIQGVMKINGRASLTLIMTAGVGKAASFVWMGWEVVAAAAMTVMEAVAAVRITSR